MNNRFIFFAVLIFFASNCFAQKTSESWVDYNDVEKISLGITKEECISILGEPLIMLADTEDSDNSTFLYYNYRIKNYTINNQKIDKNKRNIEVERMTLVKFTFYDDILVSWEEDKMTLSMSNSDKDGPSFIFTFINIFLNIVVITLNAAVLMSS